MPGPLFVVLLGLLGWGTREEVWPRHQMSRKTEDRRVNSVITARGTLKLEGEGGFDWGVLVVEICGDLFLLILGFRGFG